MAADSSQRRRLLALLVLIQPQHVLPFEKGADRTPRAPRPSQWWYREAEGDDRSPESQDKEGTVYDGKTGIRFNSEQDHIVWELLQGNREYVRMRKEKDYAFDKGKDGRPKSVTYLEHLQEDPISNNGGSLRQVKVKALVVTCARSFAPMDHIFGTEPRELQVVKVCGYTCAIADSMLGSIEFELADTAPPVLMVVGNSRNEIIASALRQVMRIRGMPIPPEAQKYEDEDEWMHDSKLLQASLLQQH
jgi:hypothetical protein